MFGLVKSLLSSALEPGKESPSFLPQTSEDAPAKRYGVWDSFFDPGAAYAEAKRLRGKGWKVRVTERKTGRGTKYFVWIGRKETPQILPQAILIEGGERVPPQYSGLVGWISQTLPEYSLLTEPQLLPAVEAELKERRIDAVLRQLKDGVETIQQSERFRLFLVTMSKFHDYSIGNQILIMIQKPDATRVAGFNTWKDLGRWVKRGEKGIAILAPVMPPKPKPEEKEEEELEEVELRPVYFKVVYIFDVSQTEGKPLPEFEVPVLTGEVNEELFSRLLSLMKSQSVSVSFESRAELPPDIKGQYLAPNRIWVRPEEPRAQQLKTLLHEVAHYYSEGVFHIPRRDAETIAESAAFVVGAHHGFDTGVRSFPYVALWAQDKKVLEQNLGAIRRVSVAILESLEKLLAVEFTPMIIKCAWCGKYMGEKPPYEDKSVTHSICPECRAKYFPEKGPNSDNA
jgi:antirestriction protein ArdC